MSKRSVLPGLGLSLGFTTAYLGLVVLFPLSALFGAAANGGWTAFADILRAPRVLAACRLTLVTSLVAAGLNAVFGVLVAWVLVRYRFPGRRLVDAMVDLPFALPTAVAGIALTTLYAPGGWLGAALARVGVTVAFTPAGITVALMFVGLPFVVRAVQPVLQDLEPELEEVAASLGASPGQVVLRVIGPTMLPAILTGFTLAFARGLGEYGSVVFIAGNMPMRTEVAPLLIMAKLEQFDYPGAAAIGAVLLLASFTMLLAINLLQVAARRRLADGEE
ncbi:MAG: sulfate ABC transporter permease subunit CysT [Gemmatimonadota bacterium]